MLSAHAQEIPSPDRPEDTQTAGTVNITWSPSNHRCKGAEVQAVVTVEEIDPDVEDVHSQVELLVLPGKPKRHVTLFCI